MEFHEPTFRDAIIATERAFAAAKKVTALAREEHISAQDFINAVKEALEACLFAQLTCDWAANGRLT